MEDYYSLLGVEHSCSQQEIRSAYLKLLKKYHPDVYKGDLKFAEQFTAKLNQAYHVLSNCETRKNFDEQFVKEEQKNAQAYKSKTNQETQNNNKKEDKTIFEKQEKNTEKNKTKNIKTQKQNDLNKQTLKKSTDNKKTINKNNLNKNKLNIAILFIFFSILILIFILLII